MVDLLLVCMKILAINLKINTISSQQFLLKHTSLQRILSKENPFNSPIQSNSSNNTG